MLSKSKLKLIFYTIIALSGNLIYSSSRMSDDYHKNIVDLNKELRKAETDYINAKQTISPEENLEKNYSKLKPALTKILEICYRQSAEAEKGIARNDHHHDKLVQVLFRKKKDIEILEKEYKSLFPVKKTSPSIAITACGAGESTVASVSTNVLVDQTSKLPNTAIRCELACKIFIDKVNNLTSRINRRIEKTRSRIESGIDLEKNNRELTNLLKKLIIKKSKQLRILESHPNNKLLIEIITRIKQEISDTKILYASKVCSTSQTESVANNDLASTYEPDYDDTIIG